MFYPKVGEINVHAQTVCTRPSPPPNFRRPGYKARMGWENSPLTLWGLNFGLNSGSHWQRTVITNNEFTPVVCFHASRSLVGYNNTWRWIRDYKGLEGHCSWNFTRYYHIYMSVLSLHIESTDYVDIAIAFLWKAWSTELEFHFLHKMAPEYWV